MNEAARSGRVALTSCNPYRATATPRVRSNGDRERRYAQDGEVISRDSARLGMDPSSRSPWFDTENEAQIWMKDWLARQPEPSKQAGALFGTRNGCGLFRKETPAPRRWHGSCPGTCRIALDRVS